MVKIIVYGRSGNNSECEERGINENNDEWEKGGDHMEKSGPRVSIKPNNQTNNEG